MQNKEVNIRELQLVELNILKEFISICKNLNLRYFLAGGSVLGTVRHNGFIPWDDDIDVIMPRKDYETFLEKGQDLMQKKYFLQTYKTDPEYTMGYAKIRNSETTFIEATVQKQNINHGVFIDIFPLDGYNPNRRIKNAINKIQYKLYNIHIDKSYTTNIKRSIKSHIINAFTDIIYGNKNIVQLLEKKEKIATKYNYDESEYVCPFFDPVKAPLSLVFPKNYFGNGVVKKFEGIDVVIPQNYDAFLKQHYGDYMKLPPEEERKPHHYNQIIDLEKSYKYYKNLDKE